MTESERKIPSKEELIRSRDYFAGLETRATFSRDVKDFLAEELPEHFANLKYSAGRLDNLPEDFWKFHSSKEWQETGLPYLPMQIILWGRHNDEKIILARGDEPEMRFKGLFSLQAHIYETIMDLRADTHRSNLRDNAEQCKRIVSAYLDLGEYFDEKGLPEGVEEF